MASRNPTWPRRRVVLASILARGWAKVTVVIVVVVLALTGIIALYLLRRRIMHSPASRTQPADVGVGTRDVRQNALEEHENELLQRRLHLESRRGPLGGDDRVYDQFVDLERRLQAREIGEEEFEREKIRLLGG